MEKITVREFDKVIARLTITELIVFKVIMNLLEISMEYYEETENKQYIPLLCSNESLIRNVNKITCANLSDYEIIKNFESLCKKGILTKDDDVSEISEALKNYFYITINWDAEIEEAVLPDGYTGRIF